jgi:hypothetical protein
MPFQETLEALAGSSILLQQIWQAVPAVLQQSGADCCDVLDSCILHAISHYPGFVTSFWLRDALHQHNNSTCRWLQLLLTNFRVIDAVNPKRAQSKDH